MERLQKLIAAAGICSRRAAEDLICQGRVTVNGKMVIELGAKAGPGDEVCVDGKPVRPPKRLHYVLLNKPPGYVTTRHDPQQRATVYDLLYETDATLHPVGRLDQDTCGLLLLTDDGSLTFRLTHARYGVQKVYRVWTRPPPNQKTLAELRRGVELEDGPVKPQDPHIPAPDCYQVTLLEGRKREVRRTFEALGCTILRLQRIRLGPLELGDLKEGKARPLRPDEVRRLQEAAGL